MVSAEAGVLSCSESEDGSDCSLESLITTTTGNPAPTIASVTPTITEDSRSCTPFPFDKPIVQYSIVYTSTVTFYGNVSDYTPPYEPIKTPDYCTVLPSTAAPMVTPAAKEPEPSNLEPEASEALFPDLPVPEPTGLPLPAVDTLLTPIVVFTSQDAAKMKGGSLVTVTLPPIPKILHQVVTFITTEKNPAVVFPTESAPAFSQTFLSIPDSFNPQVHKTVDDADEEAAPTITPSPSLPNPVNSVKLPPKPSFAVTAGGNTVIINDNTFTGLSPGQTTTITVGPATFTLLPTAVQGMGSTITKPAPQDTRMPTPTSANVGGVPVTVSGSEAVISGITVRIPLQTTSTTTIGGHNVTLAPGTVSVGPESLTFVATTPRPTGQVVSGGKLMTVIGRSLVVMGANTLTYGSNIPRSTTVVGGDTITIGPSGVDLRGTTLGGPSADATGTELEIVGGVTVGRLPNSHVVINGQTFTLNARGVSRTALLGSEIITIRNDGLVMSSTTIAYPADAYVTATIRPTGSWADAMPTETGGAISRTDKSAASSRQRNILFGSLHFSMAIGVSVGIGIGIGIGVLF
ncbi:hypothetical protein ESCO_005167 [Escovopsis weberi]|uniref:Uncharacterized protein n=1 Tax=Escovopsis weberi TaxID=150374 RepID=A0A0M8N7H4_ESCWE|nr:hypothetical protein ESCO_005167 [Escovopsis weberi]